MYQQPITQTLTTAEFLRTINYPVADEPKLSARDGLLFLAQSLGGLALCFGLHFAFS